MKLTEKQKLRKRLKSFCGMMGESLGSLDADLLTRIETTIDKLGKPTKIAIAGLSGSQHRGVGEFFIGEKLFASAEEAKSCPVIEVRYGKEPQTDAIFGDTQKSYPGISVSVALAGKRPDALRLQLPYAIFAEIDFTILPAYDGDDNRAGYLVKLLDDTEVIIWCSDATKPWGPQERRLWFTVPDTLKERSILALTNAENLTSAAASNALAEKLEFVTGEFSVNAKISVDDAKASVRAGNIDDAIQFASSGGQAILKDVMALVQDGQAGLMTEARALRGEIDKIPLGEAMPAPETPLAKLATAPAKEAPKQTPHEQALHVILDGAKKCRASLEACSENDYGPLFDALNTCLAEITKFMGGDLALDRDHDLMVRQVSEASELIGLLTYENNEKAAFEATDALRQISTDIWQRLPRISEPSTRNISDSERMSTGS